MKKFWQTLISIVRYSTVTVTVNLNPVQWRLWPYFHPHSDDVWENATVIWTGRIGWLAVSARIIIDDGRW